jgi:5,5'-dehydrodivanillate O-demethylase
MRRFWQPVYLAADLPVGHAKPIRVMSEDFTLYRGEEGTPHLVDPRCAHRGTQLSTGWVEGDCLRCFYHGWKYDGSGQCVEQPAEDGGFASKVRIKSYPTREYLGLIFVYLGDAERGDTGAFRPPAFPPCPAFRGEGLIEAETEIFPCNYFQHFENSADEVHVSFVHRIGSSHQGIYDLPLITGEETDYGVARYGTRPNGDVRVTLHLMPNFTRVVIPPMAGLQGAGGWRDIYLFFVPIDDEHHRILWTQLVRVTGAEAEAYQAQYARFQAQRVASRPTTEVAADILAGRLRIQDVEHPEMVIVQDKVAQMGQGRIADRSRERLGRSDVGIRLLRKIWERELRALAEGRPLKEWRCPDDVEPVIGF